MNTKPIESRFEKMGARLKVREIRSRWRQGDREWLSPVDFSVDVQRDGRGEYFEICIPTHLRDSLEIHVAQSEERLRHLLLFVRTLDGPSRADRFLCGHDEREWFVAAVPGGASSVRQAMDALQPREVRDALTGVAWKKRTLRKNSAFLRQGEWFFVPVPELVADEQLVRHHEPIRRGRGKPHWVEMLCRTGGEAVHVCAKHPNGLSRDEYRWLVRSDPQIVRWGWRVMRRNPKVYVRGTVRHEDHATIVLPCWHRVLMNTENQTRTFQNVAFLD